MKKQNRAALELVFAGSIWGFGFVAVIWVLETLSPSAINSLRFTVSTIFGFAISLLVPSWKLSINKKQMRVALGPGVFLGLMLILQTWGLKYTTATNSAFITCLYVVFVPVLQVIILNKRLNRFHVLFVVIGIFGTALITGFNLTQINIGDILTFFCAIAGALQIIWVDKVRDQIDSPFVFNVWQSFWCAVLSLVCLGVLLLTGVQSLLHSNTLNFRVVFGFLALSFGSVLLGFFLQIRAQKVLSPSLASMLFLLEAPFAFLFAVLLLNERISMIRLAGALIIFLSAMGAVKFEKT